MQSADLSLSIDLARCNGLRLGAAAPDGLMSVPARNASEGQQGPKQRYSSPSSRRASSAARCVFAALCAPRTKFRYSVDWHD